MNRAIIIYPEFENIKLIQDIRKLYDPLFKYIEPHLTLVFPFQSDLSTDDLKNHISKKLKGLNSFNLVARGITGTLDGYIFLDIKIGNDYIIELHDLLYSELLKSYVNRFIPYTPHITVGRIFDLEVHKRVVESLEEFNIEFNAKIDKIVLECIDSHEKSSTEFEFKL